MSDDGEEPKRNRTVVPLDLDLLLEALSRGNAVRKCVVKRAPPQEPRPDRVPKRRGRTARG